MGVAEAMAQAKRFAADELGLQATVVAGVKEGDLWRISVEAVVEGEYMRQRAQRELIGRYEIMLDESLTVTGFERKEVRERGVPTSSS